MIKEMGKEKNMIKMVKYFMMVNLKMENLKDMGDSILKMEDIMKVIF